MLDRLSDYDYSTAFRHASMKRHGVTTDWLTTSTKFINWMSVPKPKIFMLSGKRGSPYQVNSPSIAYGFVQLALRRPSSRLNPNIILFT